MRKTKWKKVNQKPKYIVFNKPYGVLCQFTDPGGRPTLRDYLRVPGVYAVGRLDIDSEGLLILTDDGELNHRLSDPNHRQFKTYYAQVEGIPTDEQLEKLKNGIVINGESTMPAEARRLPDDLAIWARPKPIRFRKSIPTSWIEIKIMEGKNHQVKKMTAAVGLPCLRLIRMAVGPIEIGSLEPGKHIFISKPRL